MGIQPTSAYTAPSSIANLQQQRHASAGTTVMFAESAPPTADKTAISQAARARAAEEMVGGMYDFTNMSPDDILPAINSLLKSGQMSLDESSHLLMLVPITIGGQTAPPTVHQKVNLFSAMENWLAFHKSTHNDSGVLYAQKALTALRRIQASHQTGG